MEEEKIDGIVSKCCYAGVHKYYNSRCPGKEEEFICNKCDKECDFEENTPNRE